MRVGLLLIVLVAAEGCATHVVTSNPRSVLVESWWIDGARAQYRRLHGRRIPGFTDRAVAALLDYDYPGNIRELENMIESAVILSEDDAPLDTWLLFASTPGAVRRSLRVDAAGRLEPSTDRTLTMWHEPSSKLACQSNRSSRRSSNRPSPNRAATTPMPRSASA
jgi:DNA-binding NtrC family response regulator